jgi:hypothetical protein
MPISVAERLGALLDTIKAEQFDVLPPARLRQLADTMRHWAAIADQRADRKRPQRQSGVLADLRRGLRPE